MNNKFSGLWIPPEIYSMSDISPIEKIILSEICNLHLLGECYASNDFFAIRTGVSKSRVTQIISKLNQKGLLQSKLIYKVNSKEVEKRILKPLINVDNNLHSNKIEEKSKEVIEKPKKQVKRFQKPSCQEILDYTNEIGSSVDPEKFWDYYESNGWKVGKNSMKDWKATVRNWEKNNKERVQHQPKKNLNFDDLQYDENDNFKGVW